MIPLTPTVIGNIINAANQMVLEAEREKMQSIQGNCFICGARSGAVKDGHEFIEINKKKCREQEQWGTPVMQLVTELQGSMLCCLECFITAAGPDWVPDELANSPLTPEEQQELRNGHVIPAIKLIRARTGLGLKESKDLADAFREQNNYFR